MSTNNLIQYRCRRGLLELDLIFEQFCENNLSALNDADKTLFLELLNHEDGELWTLLQQSQSPNKFSRLIKLIQDNKEPSGEH